jgi:hypothetical protein
MTNILQARYRIHYTEVGAEVKIHGVAHGPARLVAKNDGFIVVHFKGFSYNPGSRYSGFKSYSPAEFCVYQCGESGWFTDAIDWKAR